MGAGDIAYWELKVVAINEVWGSFLVVATELDFPSVVASAVRTHTGKPAERFVTREESDGCRQWLVEDLDIFRGRLARGQRADHEFAHARRLALLPGLRRGTV